MVPRASLGRFVSGAWLAGAALGHRALPTVKLLGQALALLVVLAGLGIGGQWAAQHVLVSPRFALGHIEVTSTTRLTKQEVIALAGVQLGDRLLALDTDRVAAVVARHPWVASVRVARQLPSGLEIDVVERRAAAVVSLGGLYLIDSGGRPFKRATMDEAEGLPVLTGILRPQYMEQKAASEAAFREALEVVAAYRHMPRSWPADRPPLGEVNIDPRFGFTLFLRDGGTEVRLGRGSTDEKLATFDEILEALKASGGLGPGAVRTVHLDGANRRRVSVRLATTLLTQATHN